MRRAVSVADAAVEVGESLLAADTERHNCRIARTSSAIPVPLVTAVFTESNTTCTDTNAAPAAVQQSAVCELLPGAAVASWNVFCHQHNVTQNQLSDHERGSNYHISESQPAVVIMPDESMSQRLHLSCDEHSSGENSAELNCPLDNLAQREIIEPAEPMVCYPITC